MEHGDDFAGLIVNHSLSSENTSWDVLGVMSEVAGPSSAVITSLLPFTACWLLD